jgi:glycosyltransferase involved in cell wall biosynthesis
LTTPLDLLLGTLRFHPVYAGPALRFQRYAPGLRARDVNLRVFSGSWGDEAPGLGEKPGTLLTPDDVDGIPVQRVRVRQGSRRRMAMQFDGALATYACREPRPHVLQLLNVDESSIPQLFRLRRAGVPTVFTHTMMRDPSVGRLKNLSWSLPLRVLDCVVVSTGVMRDELRALGVRTRIEIIPNGLDLERFRPLGPAQRAEVKGRLGFGPNEELVLFVGGFLERRKGIDSLIAAWHEIALARPQARLVLVGPHLNDLQPADDQKSFHESLLASLAASGAEDRVTFTGRVSAVEQYHQVADVFVFPSRREGMPNVVPAAFGCGVASVLTRFEGLPAEFGRPGDTYVVAEREALADPVIELLANPERRAALGASARDWVTRELDVDRSLDSYSSLYRELAERSRRGLEGGGTGVASVPGAARRR